MWRDAADDSGGVRVGIEKNDPTNCSATCAVGPAGRRYGDAMTSSDTARRRLLQGIGAACAAVCAPALAAGFDVRALGARGDGTTLDTDAINAAIAAASAAGGGTCASRPGAT